MPDASSHPTGPAPVRAMRAAHATRDRSPRLVALALALVCFAIYFGVGRYYFVLDAYPNEVLPEALLRHRSLTFEAYHDQSRPETPYVFVIVGDRVVSFYPIVPGLLNIPAYLVARAAGLPFQKGVIRLRVAKATAAWVTAASVACMYLALVRLLPGGALGAPLLVALVYAFGTCVWPIGSQTLWQHGPSLMFLTASLACLVRPESRLFTLAGFFLAMAFWNRPASALLVAPLAAYVLLHHPRRLAGFVAAAIPPALAMGLYSQLYWGSLAALGQGFRSSGTFLSLQYHTRAPLLPGLAGLLFSPARGLFVFTPVFLLTLPALVRSLLRPEPPLLRYLVIGALAHIVFIAKLSFWWGGHSFGYRYLVETVPAFTVLLGLTYTTWSRRHRVLTHALFWPLTALSVYVQFLGAVYFPCGWNLHPVDVDRAPERLWDFHDTELGRCEARFLDDLRGGAS